MRIVDFHCDLLSYLAEGHGRADALEARCSWPQLRQGCVTLQVMALYTETSANSTLSFQKQMDCYQNLPTLYPEQFVHCHALQLPQSDDKIHVLAAVENASGLVLENEPLSLCFRRLDEFLALCSPVVYISLTWNTENRFGGGNQSQIGLKDDGKQLLQYLEGKHIAIDLSHASDQLAYDVLNYLEQENLNLIPIASHSNFRAVCQHPRNLPDELAQEIIRRGGFIGLNLFRPFIGSSLPGDLIAQAEYVLKKGWWEGFCFGADFFCDKQFSHLLSYAAPFYARSFEDSSCYPRLLELLSSICSAQQLQQLAYGNAAAFLTRLKEGAHAYSR
ncbi:MAG: membrane dipeptidase [Verrucomicrobia bacterium]|nr:membrane dipeptidase [Verrucomicrobiota bacterium]MBS0645895.1 membrane dipeptidase [Verrucomicrobiota bacterium]